MKIGIVCYPTYGGSGVVATELGMALAERGHAVHFITYGLPFRLNLMAANISYHEVTVNDYPLFDYPPYELLLTSKLVDVARYEGLDLLHVHYAIPHASAAFHAQRILDGLGVHLPFVTTLHGTDITLVGKDRSFEPVTEFSINASDCVTAVSESLKQDTLSHFNIKKEIVVIPNFICMDRYGNNNGSGLRKMVAAAGEKILLHISNFRKVKRVEDVARVFAKVREKVPAKLLLVGDGPERKNIEDICRKLNTCDDIRFTGKIKSPEKALAAADLFLVTSETESFGLSALEAMASGVPVISTNRGGLPEVNKDAYSGFLHEVGDIEGMAASAIALLTDDAMLSEFKANAKAQAELFDIKNILPQYMAIYESLLRA
ncbi:MAG: N-acetyl-alpha-D-glucosaminyl L-malate synthase BshA [Flavobacteriales bacterium]